MMKRSLVWLMAAGLICSLAGVAAVHADSDDTEEIQIHPLAVYPNVVQLYATDNTLLLTKDSLSQVKKFYTTKKIAGDRIEDYKDGEEQGFRLVYYKTIKGKERSVQELECTEHIPTTEIHDALGELKAQVMMGRHSEAEYKVLEGQYKNLKAAYYREVDDNEGGTISEGKQIYKKAYNQAHGQKKSKSNASEQAAGKARSQDMKKQMQALKAAGDYAGMMKLAQQSSKSGRQTSAGAEAMDEMEKDTWELWVTCLKDLKAAAYWTKLQYSTGALPE